MKAELLTSLDTRRLPDGTRRLLAPLIVREAEILHIVPEGFVTDYSSIPWIGRAVVRWSRVDIAGVVHDWYFETGELTLHQANEVWERLARSGDHRANWVQAKVCRAGLYAGSLFPWRKYRCDPDSISRNPNLQKLIERSIDLRQSYR